MADSDITVSALAVAGGVKQLVCVWTWVAGSERTFLPYMHLDVFEVWAASTNNRSLATKVGEVSTQQFVLANLASPTTRYIWVRARDRAGNNGEFYPVSATAGISGTTQNSLPGPGEITSTMIGDDQILTPHLGANQVTAVKMEIGSRTSVLDGVTFEYNRPSNNRVRWSAGTMRWTRDDGVLTTSSIPASATGVWTSGTIFIYWVKGESLLRTTTVQGTAITPNTVLIATYQGGAKFVQRQGQTIIDGDRIQTGSIDADHITALKIDAVEILQNGTTITDLIAANAATNPFADVVASAISVSTTSQTPTTISTWEFTGKAADNQQVIIQFEMFLEGASSIGQFKIDIRRNGTIRRTFTFDQPNYVSQIPGFSIGIRKSGVYIEDTVLTGTNTFELEIIRVPPGTGANGGAVFAQVDSNILSLHSKR